MPFRTDALANVTANSFANSTGISIVAKQAWGDDSIGYLVLPIEMAGTETRCESLRLFSEKKYDAVNVVATTAYALQYSLIEKCNGKLTVAPEHISHLENLDTAKINVGGLNMMSNNYFIIVFNILKDGLYPFLMINTVCE